jgi:putative addiction module component (TIGR02574 family)
MENITAKQAQPELTSELKQELDRRSRAYDANPDDVMTREEVRASIAQLTTSHPSIPLQAELQKGIGDFVQGNYTSYISAQDIATQIKTLAVSIKPPNHERNSISQEHPATD